MQKTFFAGVLAAFSPSAEHRSDALGKATTALVLLNIAAIFWESLSPNAVLLRGIRIFEFISVVAMSGEYFLRILSARAFLPRKAFFGFFSPLFLAEGVILLFGFFHFFSPTFVDLRIFWIFRIFHFWENVPFVRVLRQILREHGPVLSFAVSLMLSTTLVFATLLFFVEHEAQPEKFSSIPAAIWWAIVTFFTIGYGDIFPITDTGRFLAMIGAFFGVTIFGLPSIIVWSAFFNELISQERQKRTRLEKRLHELERERIVSHERHADSDFPTLLQKK